MTVQGQGIVIYVPDVEQSAAFYKKAFGAEDHHFSVDHQARWIRVGNLDLFFLDVTDCASAWQGGAKANSKNRQPMGMELRLIVPDIYEARERAIAAGAEPGQGVMWVHGSVQLHAKLREPSGYIIHLLATAPPDHRAWQDRERFLEDREIGASLEKFHSTKGQNPLDVEP